MSDKVFLSRLKKINKKLELGEQLELEDYRDYLRADFSKELLKLITDR
jgi:hypothetical protein